MKKTIIPILAIFLLGFTLAVYPGETITVSNELGKTNLVYTIVDNSTEIPELNITVNESNISIFFPYNSPPDNFKVVFIEEQTKEVVKEVRISSGGGSRKTVYKNNTIYLNDTRYIPVENECPNCIVAEPETKIEFMEIDYPKSKYITAGVIMSLILLGLLIWVFSERKRRKEEENFNLYNDKKEENRIE